MSVSGGLEGSSAQERHGSDDMAPWCLYQIRPREEPDRISYS